MLSRVAFVKTSLIDFPGRLASVLFFPLCDFRCPYCQNAALVEPEGREDPGLVSLGEFLEFLDRRKSLISGVVLSGGEPLLHEEAPRVARAIRERGLAVKLDTNGSFPSRIAEVAPDYTALDFKTSPAAYDRLAPGQGEAAGRAVLESMARLRSSGSPFEIRITCVPGIVGTAEAEAMAGCLEGSDEVVLQAFRPGGCLDPGYDGVEPYSRAEMAELLTIFARSAPKARLRGAQEAALARGAR
jgi:pyruvate formate lyase activating enzyme